MGQFCSCELQEDAVTITEKAEFGWNNEDYDEDYDDGDLQDASTQPPSSKTLLNFEDLSPLSRVSEIEDIDALILLCSKGRVAEALTNYEQMEEQANVEGDKKLLSCLHSHPDLHDLRVIKKRRAAYMKRLVEPTMKAWQEDDWKSFVLTDPEIDPIFKVNMRIRFARGAERNPARGGTQILIHARAEGFPVSLMKFAAFHSRVHLIRKEWIKDCERFIGVGAQAKTLHTALLTSLLAPKILPMKLEDVIFRNFIFCKEAPSIPGSRPGIMVMESSPEEKMTTYEGIELPKPRRGVVQITGSEKMNYFMPGLAGPEYMDVLSCIRAQLPIPQWLVPLELVKRFLADVFTGALKQIIEHVASKWDDMPFVQEIQADPGFFNQVQELIDASARADGSQIPSSV